MLTTKACLDWTLTWIQTSQARVAELEESTVSLEMRVEEAEGNLAAAQAEAETAVTDLDNCIKELTAEQSERLASVEAALHTEVTLEVHYVSIIVAFNTFTA